MKLRDLMKMQRKGGSPPTLKPQPLRPRETQYAQQGICLKCGRNPAQRTSYICAPCAGLESNDSILREIDSARSKILG